MLASNPDQISFYAVNTICNEVTKRGYLDRQNVSLDHSWLRRLGPVAIMIDQSEITMRIALGSTVEPSSFVRMPARMDTAAPARVASSTSQIFLPP